MSEQVPLNRASGKRYGLAALMLCGAVTLGLASWLVYAKTIHVDVVEKEEAPVMVIQKPIEVDLAAFDEPEMPTAPPVAEMPTVMQPAVQPAERIVYRDRIEYRERKPPAVSKAATSAPIIVASNAVDNQQVAQSTSDSGSTSGLGVAIVRNDLSRRINQGVTITGTLQTQLDTTFSGQVACQIDRDVYSADGEVRLLNAGDMMIGNYDSGMISPGVRRIYLSYETILGRRIDHGIEITMNTPGTNTLGTTGMAARIDNHFWQQWNSVIAAAIVDVAVSEATRDTHNAGAIILGRAANETSSLAQEMLRQTGRIQPTAFSDRGDPCGTTLKHPLVFAENVSYVN